MTPWQLRVLGTPHLHRAGQPPVPLERKPAALLAYLALEGPTPRSRLAGLLWPEGSDASARNNLRQTLFNLRRFEGLFSGSDPLGLGPGVESDVAELQSQVTSGQGQGLEWQGQLLEGYDYDDCPEFEEWLLHERERLRELRREALGLLCERLEREGKLAEALSWAQKLLEADPISEASHRRVMRLHYLLGDRAAALRAYQRCAEVLQRELGVRPLEETVALAEEIGRGALPVLPPAQHKPIPLALQRPPVLAGREREWALMEEAWEAGRVIYVVGEPGIGKTRLVQDFAASKGGGLYLPARPGFREIPFAAAVSLARARLAAAPEVVLPPWVRLELARILPELREEGEPPAQGEGERLRFYQAYLELVRLTGARFAASISDDVQYYDQATIELGAYLISQRAAYGLNRDIPRYVMTYRPGELTPQAQATVDELVASGLAARVELRPLEPAAVAVLLDGLRLPLPADPARLTPELHRHTGGNPLFVLETLKHLLGSDAPPARLPHSERVQQIILRRLERLSATALQAARVAAVLQSDAGVELVAEVLGTPLLEIAGAWEELEAHQIVQGERFSHDLIYETVAAHTPAALRGLFQRLAAEKLAARGGNPARVAQLWLASGHAGQAVPYLLEAAQAAEAGFLHAQAAGLYAQALELARTHGPEEVAAEAARRLGALEGSPPGTSREPPLPAAPPDD